MIKKDNYEKYANCIQMEQMAAPEIAELFEDGKFRKWYRNEYNIRTDNQSDTSQEEWIKGYNKWQTKKERCPHN
jgi:hypothetical protein